jgi:hypothetical protein
MNISTARVACRRAALVLLIASGVARADDPASDGLTLKDGLPVICTDRPTKANYACAVEDGHFQYEGDIVNDAMLDTGAGSVRTLVFVDPTLKYGIGHGIDLEASIAALETVRSGSHSVSGPGDLYLRVKDEFVDTLGGALQVAAIAFVKAPTAPVGIGNGAVEGGLIAPVNVKIGDKIILTTAPELDRLANAAGNGTHFNTAQLVNIAYAFTPRLTAYGELWADWNFDPEGTTRQSSLDGAVTYLLTAYLQVDVGVNLGLKRSTATQGYLGLSQKF